MTLELKQYRKDAGFVSDDEFNMLELVSVVSSLFDWLDHTYVVLLVSAKV